MNNKSVRLQILQYLQEYFTTKNAKTVKKGRKVKTSADVVKDLQQFCLFAKKEVGDLRKDLKVILDVLSRKSDDREFTKIYEELGQFTNVNEEAVLQRLMQFLQAFEQEKDKVKRREILIQLEDFVYNIMSNEHLEVSWDLYAFLKECFFIYYSQQAQKAEIEYGVNPKDDKEIENSVAEKVQFLREVMQ